MPGGNGSRVAVRVDKDSFPRGRFPRRITLAQGAFLRYVVGRHFAAPDRIGLTIWSGARRAEN
jgi:hypothetical protein